MLRDKMLQELRDKQIFGAAHQASMEYIDNIDSQDVTPSEENLALLKEFDGQLQDESISALSVLETLHKFGTPNTVAQTGGRFFGFVNGGALPATMAVKWLSDVWDQNGGLYVASPINSKLEVVCEDWLKDIFNLPEETIASYVSGTSMANLTCLIAARYHLLQNAGWDVNKKGLNGAPQIKIIGHEQTHASIKKTLTQVGFGTDNVTWLPSDDQGRMITSELPELDDHTLLLLQAGNANTGAFDPLKEACEKANKAGAWVHVDGAFGLWAGATKKLKHLTEGMELASSWAVDGHKTLNTPYDSGIAMCRHPESLFKAMYSKGDYFVFSDKRDSLSYGPEMSKRCRAIELWAAMKYLGKNGIDELVTNLHQRAIQLAEGLSAAGFTIQNEVVFNQVLLRCESNESTKRLVEKLQQSREIWLGGTVWKGEPAIRVSVCSWMTGEEDIERTVALFKRLKAEIV